MSILPARNCSVKQAKVVDGQGREAIPAGRFSSDKQAAGDSKARQHKSFVRICERWKLTPSTRYAIFDEGLSAYHGEHLERGQFGKFLRAAEAGEIKPDNQGRMPCLCFEAVDRFCRLIPYDANAVIRRFIKVGIPLIFDEIVGWVDEETYPDVNLILQVLIDQAYQYSRRLARRMNSVWEGKRESEEPTKHHCPHWLQWDDGSYTVIEEEARTVKQIFLWCASGNGIGHILKRLPNTWHHSVVGRLLRDKAVLGEYQPLKKTDGLPPVKPNEYPAIISEDLFYSAARSLDSRKTARGPRGKTIVNLFKGLLYNLDDEPLWIFGDGPRWCRRVLRSRTASHDKKGTRGVPYPWVESAILHLVSELKPEDLRLKIVAESASDIIRTKISKKEENIARTQAALEEEYSRELHDVLKRQVKERDQLQTALDKARAEETDDQDQAILDTKSCFESLLATGWGCWDNKDMPPNKDAEDLRIRLSGLIPQVITRIVVIPGDEQYTAAILVAVNKGNTWYRITIEDLRVSPVSAEAAEVCSYERIEVPASIAV